MRAHGQGFNLQRRDCAQGGAERKWFVMNRPISIAFFAMAAAGLGACTTYGPAYGPPAQPLPPPDVPFSAEAFSWSQVPGGASVSGSVGFQGVAGAYSCAGTTAALIPDTPYSRGRIARLYGVMDRAAVPIGEVRARQEGRAREAYAAFARTARCDAQGRFTFDRLPAGGWFLVVQARPLGAERDGEAMALLRRVRTRPGQAQQLVLR